MGTKHYFLILLGAIAISFILYGNTVGGEFVSDDSLYFNQPELRNAQYLQRVWFTSYLPGHASAGVYRPLTVFTFSLNFLLFGESPVSFHVVNILINGINIFLVWLLIATLFGGHTLAFLTALLFAFFPIHIEAVAWIKSRDELLSVMFVLLAWILYHKSTEKKGRFWFVPLILSAGSYVLAMFAKEIVIIVPVLFLTASWVRREFQRPVLLASLLCFGIAVAAVFGMRFAALGSHAFGTDDAYFIVNPLKGEDLGTRVWTSSKMLTMYVVKTIVPLSLSQTYSYNHLPIARSFFASWESVAGVCMVVVYGIALLWRGGGIVPVGLTIVIIPLLMVLKVFFNAGDIFGERWMYLPSIGVALLIAYTLEKLSGRRAEILWGAVAAICVLYANVIIPRNMTWQTREAHARAMHEEAPDSALANFRMARYLIEQNDDFAGAKPFIEAGNAIYPNHPPLMVYQGLLALRENRLEAAMRVLNRTFTIQPGYPSGYILVAQILTKQGKPEESMAVIGEFLTPLLEAPQVRFILAVNYYTMGKEDQAQQFLNWTSAISREEKLRRIERF